MTTTEGVETCVVCHGPGAGVDAAQVHARASEL
jgi:mono/diheme cytochrome c family protein